MNVYLNCSYRYWKLVPDQATVDSQKSPEDPIIAAKSIVRSNTSRNPAVSRSEQGAGSIVDSRGIDQSLDMGQRKQQMNNSPV
jgi:hypothetical protein